MGPAHLDVFINVLAALLLLLTLLAAFRSRRATEPMSADDEDRLRALLARHGERDSLGYFALRRDKSVIWSASGKAAVTYRVVGGVSVTQMTPDDYLAAFRGKALSQIELVRQGIPHLAERGSFTLITGVLVNDPIPTGSAASMANGAVESFVRAAAIEIAPQRINAVSPTIFTESVPEYGDFFPGVRPVDLTDVAQAYVRSVEGSHTGRIFELS